MILDKQNKIRGAIYGHLVADAVGTSYEFKSPGNIPPYDQIEMVPPPGYKKSWAAIPIGSWSDDGSQTLCLLEYYLEAKESEAPWYDRWAYKLLAWERGHLWCGNRPFDSGMQTAKALLALKEGKSPFVAAPSDEYANGNGSLMRALPTAIMCYDWDDEKFFQEVQNISLITHTHMRSRLCCMFYCEIARQLLSGMEVLDAELAAKEKIEAYVKDTDAQAEWDIIWEGRNDEPQGTGYVVNSLWSALYALHSTDTYEDCVKTAIELGNDTDTTACIAGGLAGILYGYDGIRTDWINALRDKHVVDNLIARIP